MSSPGLSHLRGGVAQSSVSEKTLNKAKLDSYMLNIPGLLTLFPGWRAVEL